MGAPRLEDGPHRLGVGEGGDAPLDLVDHGPEPGAAARLGLGVQLGQGHHPDRDRQPSLDRQPMGGELAGLDVEFGPGQVHPGQLGRAAADVHHQGGAFASVQQVEAAGHGKLGLLARADDLEVEPRLDADALDELRPVGGRTAGLGGDGPHPHRLATANLVGAHPQGGHGPIHGVRMQAAALRQPLAQAHDPRIGLDHPEAAGGRRGDQQPAIVGAQVERGEARRLPRAAAAVLEPLAVVDSTVRRHARLRHQTLS